jgi:hypothetical protein
MGFALLSRFGYNLINYSIWNCVLAQLLIYWFNTFMAISGLHLARRLKRGCLILLFSIFDFILLVTPMKKIGQI